MKIYFAGSIRGGRVDASLYRRMIDFMSLNNKVLTEHVGSSKLCLEEQGRDGDARIYNQDTAWLRESDLLEATPSWFDKFLVWNRDHLFLAGLLYNVLAVLLLWIIYRVINLFI